MIDWTSPQLWYGFVGGWIAAGVVVLIIGGVLTFWRKAMRASE